MSNVLVIADTHAPCMVKGYVSFLKKTYRKYKCNRVVHIGDLVDNAAISYHEKTSSLKNAETEFVAAHKQVQQLYKAFPKAHWCIGNHDALTQRQAVSAGLPPQMIREYTEIWDVPGWEVVERFGHIVIDGVQYQHGDRGVGGITAALKNAKQEFRSVVSGHLHSQAGVWWYANQRPTNEGGIIFGMNVGCGVDSNSLAMDYGRKFNSKPLVGCGVVLGGKNAHFIPMELKTN
jgi:predicted phosphodiesterase